MIPPIARVGALAWVGTVWAFHQLHGHGGLRVMLDERPMIGIDRTSTIISGGTKYKIVKSGHPLIRLTLTMLTI